MKTIFLDIDGVINHDDWYERDDYFQNNFKDPDLDPNCINLINDLCESTNAKIILSSDWRFHEQTTERLKRAGLDIFDKTIIDFKSYCRQSSRGEEIKNYLDNHPEIEKYVIFDDRTDIYPEQLPYYIHIDPAHGLTKGYIEIAKKILEN